MTTFHIVSSNRSSCSPRSAIVSASAVSPRRYAAARRQPCRRTGRESQGVAGLDDPVGRALLGEQVTAIPVERLAGGGVETVVVAAGVGPACLVDGAAERPDIGDVVGFDGQRVPIADAVDAVPPTGAFEPLANRRHGHLQAAPRRLGVVVGPQRGEQDVAVHGTRGVRREQVEHGARPGRNGR